LSKWFDAQEDETICHDQTAKWPCHEDRLSFHWCAVGNWWDGGEEYRCPACCELWPGAECG
jgi:hypothetical protein